MKRTGRILSVMLLTAIYCFAMSVVTKSIAQDEIQHAQSSEKEECYSASLSNPFIHTSQVESLVKSVHDSSVRSFKIKFTGLSLISRITEQLSLTEFSQYINSSRNFLIQHRKADMIFPFHYFW